MRDGGLSVLESIRCGLVFLAQIPVQGGSSLEINEQRALIAGGIYGSLLLLGLVINLVLLVLFFQRPPDWAARLRILKGRPWVSGAGLRALLFLVICLVAAFMALLAMAAWLGGGAPRARDLVIQTVVFHWGGLFLVAFVLLRRRWSWERAFGLRGSEAGKRLWQGLLCYLAALPFVWFFTWLFQMLLRATGMEPSMQQVAWMLTGDTSWWLRLYLLALAVVVAPWFEELLFRGMGLPFLARRFGAPMAILLVSLLFAAVHFHLSSVVPLFIIAVAFSLAYIHTGSILVPVVMHASFNAVNLAMLFFLHAA